MIHLRLLGSVDLAADDGRSIHSVLAQPKRLALLAYLAASPERFHPRDRLLALFWPEADAESARHSLRQAIYYLRRSLHESVIQNRGEEVGIDPDGVWCDAGEFERAVDVGEHERALELYRGDLLPGLHLPDAPEFERWVDVERDRLRAKAVRALRSLAEAREGSGDLSSAIGAWRRLSEIDPYSGPAALGLARALVAAGEVPEAIRQVERYVARVREDLDLAPDADVLAFAERLRSGGAPLRTTERASERALPRHSAASPAARAEPMESVPAASDRLEAVAEVPAREARRPFRPRPAPYAAVLAFALVGVLTGLLIALFAPFSGGASARVSPDRVAVLPFTVRGAPGAEYLGEGMVDLLSTRLEGVPDLRVVDPRVVLRRVGSEEAAAADLERGRRLAEAVGAGGYVMGSVTGAGDSLHVTAVLYGPGTDARARAEVVVAEENVLGLIDRLAAQLLAGRRDAGMQMGRLATVTTAYLPALKAYLRGEHHFRRQEYGRAVRSFEEALAQDSAFALAAYRLSVAADWAGEYGLGYDAAERAYRFRERLPATERRLADALWAFNRDAPADAIRLYREVLERDPENVEARYRLAETQYHYNPLLGLTPGAAVPTFERTLALDPDHAAARQHLLLLAARSGDRQVFAAHVVPLLRQAPADSLRWRHLQAVVFRDAEALARLAPARDTVSEERLWRLAEDAVLHTRNPAGAHRVAQDLLRPHRSADLHTAGHLLLAWIEMIRGRPGAAERQLSAAEELEPSAALMYRALLAGIGFLPVPPGELRALRDSLLSAGAPARENPYLPLWTGPLESRRAYLAGLLSARMGDEAGVQRALAALQPAPGDPPDAVRLLSWRRAAVRAREAAERDRPQEALALLDAPPEYGPHQPPPFREINFLERQLRPGLLRAMGREAEAVRWYAALPFRGNRHSEETLMDLVHEAPFRLERAQFLERIGRTREAAAEYARVRAIWRDAEPPVRARALEAERRLARLRTGATAQR